MKRFFSLLSSVAAALSLAATAGAQISATEAARLGADLTPVGGEMAGNAAGTIPAWTGGLTTPPANYVPGQQHVDPFAEDAPLYTINAGNAAQYAALLTEGHRALLAAYPESYQMPVFPSRRSAAFPAYYYEATKAVAQTASLINDGNSVQGAVVGAPFPIPTTGQQVIWNHLLRFRGVGIRRTVGQAAPLPNGSYVMVEIDESILFQYAQPGMQESNLNNIIAYFRQEVTAPARQAGSILIVHETMDQVKEARKAWVYNAGQRRVRRAPNVSYDNPGTASDGMRTSDQLDMFNGAIDRYEWKLVGKREMLVPYNSYKLHGANVTPRELITPLHINQALTRYELHRVWVVEATVRPGKRHIYARRTFYIDEDSWQILAVDQYNERGEIWRLSEAHCINYYEVPVFWSTLEVHTDLQARRYLVFGIDNDKAPYNFSLKTDTGDFSPTALRMEGTR